MLYCRNRNESSNSNLNSVIFHHLKWSYFRVKQTKKSQNDNFDQIHGIGIVISEMLNSNIYTHFINNRHTKSFLRPY